MSKFGLPFKAFELILVQSKKNEERASKLPASEKGFVRSLKVCGSRVMFGVEGGWTRVVSSEERKAGKAHKPAAKEAGSKEKLPTSFSMRRSAPERGRKSAEEIKMCCKYKEQTQQELGGDVGQRSCRR